MELSIFEDIQLKVLCIKIKKRTKNSHLNWSDLKRSLFLNIDYISNRTGRMLRGISIRRRQERPNERLNKKNKLPFS